ncbi:hypothetical protein ACF0H5_015577 [Mactra antiquata]
MIQIFVNLYSSSYPNDPTNVTVLPCGIYIPPPDDPTNVTVLPCGIYIPPPDDPTNVTVLPCGIYIPPPDDPTNVTVLPCGIYIPPPDDPTNVTVLPCGIYLPPPDDPTNVTVLPCGIYIPPPDDPNNVTVLPCGIYIPPPDDPTNVTVLPCVHFTFDNFTLTTQTKWILNIPCRPALIENAAPTLFGSKVRVGGNPEQGITNRAVIRQQDVSRILSQYENDRQVIEQDSLQPDELIQAKDAAELVDYGEPSISVIRKDSSCEQHSVDHMDKCLCIRCTVKKTAKSTQTRPKIISKGIVLYIVCISM